MARLYLDNDVSMQLAVLTRAAGHDVATAVEVGLSRATDNQHLLFALEQQRMLVTHNRKDFVLSLPSSVNQCARRSSERPANWPAASADTFGWLVPRRRAAAV